MFRRRSRQGPPLGGVTSAFEQTVAAVESAKETLASAAPTGRSSGTPLAEALAAFDEGLRAAAGSMPAWRLEEIAPEWDECRAALAEALRRSERLRLEASPAGYEDLYGMLGDLMEPLEAFERARRRLRGLGR